MAELMKIFALDFAGDIFNDCLPFAKIPEKSVNLFEILIFSEFIIESMFFYKYGESNKTRAQLDKFLNKMESYLINDIYLKFKKNIVDDKELNAFYNHIKNLSNSRRLEYSVAIKKDLDFLLSKSSPYFIHGKISLDLLSNHCFIIHINKGMKDSFIVRASLMLALTMERCLEELYYIYSCPSCRTNKKISGPFKGRRYKCRKCNTDLNKLDF